MNLWIPVREGAGWRIVEPATGRIVAQGLTRADAQVMSVARELLAGCEGVLNTYCALVESGDCGNWDPEREEPVKAARAAIAQAKGQT